MYIFKHKKKKISIVPLLLNFIRIVSLHHPVYYLFYRGNIRSFSLTLALSLFFILFLRFFFVTMHVPSIHRYFYIKSFQHMSSSVRKYFCIIFSIFLFSLPVVHHFVHVFVLLKCDMRNRNRYLQR